MLFSVNLYYSALKMQTAVYRQKINTPVMGEISFSGKALILLATHKCVKDWPASHATNTYLPVNGSRGSNMHI